MTYTLEQLQQDIDRGRLRTVYFFHGPEEFLKERAVQAILGKFVPPDLKDFNLDVLYGDETDAASIVDRVASLPMMAERRLVLVRNVDHLPADERRKILEYSAPSEKRKLLDTLEKDIHKKERELQSRKRKPGGGREDVGREDGGRKDVGRKDGGQENGGREDGGQNDAVAQLDDLLRQKRDVLEGLKFAFPHACLLLTATDGDVPGMFYRGGSRKKASGSRSTARGAGTSPSGGRRSSRSDGEKSSMGPWLNEFVDRVVASVEFSPPSDAEIPEQVRQLASHHGKSIASQAVDLLVQAVGNDLMALDNELAKLSIFIAQRPEIGPQDVEMVVGELRVRSVFDLCDAILSGNRPGSLSLLGRLLEAGLVVPQLTGALRWRLTLLTQSRRGRRGSGPPQLDAERLEEAFGLLYQTELSVNTGRQSPRMAMTLLTNQLCRLFGTKEK